MSPEHVELRVHGVAGGAPAPMLQLDPVRARPDAAPDIVEWRQPPPRPSLRAWSWGSLTSGRWYHALYLLLLPFMLANLAGWMLVSRVGTAASGASRGLRIRAAILAVRVVGLAITLVFALSAQLVLADLLAYHGLVYGLDAPPVWIGVGTVASTAVVLGVVALTRLRPAPGPDGAATGGAAAWRGWVDPAGHADLHRDQWPMWNSPGVNVALRRLHVAAVLSLLAVVGPADVGALRPGWSVLGTVATVLGAVGVGVAVGLLAWISLADGGGPAGVEVAGRGMPPRWLVRHGSWPVPAVGLVAAVACTPGLPWDAAQGPAVLPAVRDAGPWLGAVVVAGVLVVLLAAGRPSGRRTVQIANAPGLLLLAAAFGTLFGGGIAQQAVSLVEPCLPESACLGVGDYVGWTAVSLVTLLVVIAVVAGVVAAVRARARPAAGLSAVTARASWLMGLTTVLGIVVSVLAGVAVVLRRGLPPVVTSVPPALADAVVVLLVVLVAAATFAVLRRGRSRWVAAAGALGAAAVAVVLVLPVLTGAREGWSVQVIGVTLPVPDFAQLTLTLAVVVPFVLVVRQIVAGLTDLRARQVSGVLWDVGTFWPRWFHPLAPPSYSDRVVPNLTRRMTGPDDGAPLLVAAHSQGSVIAGTAVLGAASDASLEHVALLTFGAPWHRLYAEFFPAYFGPESTQAVRDRLDGRWRNLFRVSDPIGGPVERSDVDAPELADPAGLGHSDYWLDPAYAREATALVERVASSVERARDR